MWNVLIQFIIVSIGSLIIGSIYGIGSTILTWAIGNDNNGEAEEEADSALRGMEQ